MPALVMITGHNNSEKTDAACEDETEHWTTCDSYCLTSQMRKQGPRAVK